MSMSLRPCRRRVRGAFSSSDLLWLIVVLLLLIAILIPSLARAREVARRSVCAANQRGIMQGCMIYSNDNQDWLPHHYFTEPIDGNPQVAWMGTMGSSASLSVTQATSTTRSPASSHPSRSLFLLVIAGVSTPKQFVCPGSTEVVEDDLRNFQNDTPTASQPGVNRFDFAGYDRLSYGYQLPYGAPETRPHRRLDARVAIVADRGPYFMRGPAGVPGSRTVRDQRSPVSIAQWQGLSANDAVSLPAAAWRPYNSRTHQREGQNVAAIDGHVDWVTTPHVGPRKDNIYTLQDGADRFTAAMVGAMPTDPTTTAAPRTASDSCIVP